MALSPVPSSLVADSFAFLALLNEYFNKKYYRTIYLFIGLLLVSIYVLFEPYNRIIILFTSIILLLIAYFYDKKTDQKLVNLFNLKKN